MSEPATKQDLDEAMGVLRDEMRATTAELRGEMGQIRGEMKDMKAELLLEIGAAVSRATNVMAEEFRRQFAAVDDKYGDLRPRHDKLRADLDTHTTDLSVHARRPVAPPKRTRRPRSR